MLTGHRILIISMGIVSRSSPRQHPNYSTASHKPLNPPSPTWTLHQPSSGHPQMLGAIIHPNRGLVAQRTTFIWIPGHSCGRASWRLCWTSAPSVWPSFEKTWKLLWSMYNIVFASSFCAIQSLCVRSAFGFISPRGRLGRIVCVPPRVFTRSISFNCIRVGPRSHLPGSIRFAVSEYLIRCSAKENKRLKISRLLRGLSERTDY